MGAGDDVAAIAAHEAELGSAGDRWQWLVRRPRVRIAGPRRRVDRVGVVELVADGGGAGRSGCNGGGGGGGERWEWWWIHLLDSGEVMLVKREELEVEAFYSQICY